MTKVKEISRDATPFILGVILLATIAILAVAFIAAFVKSNSQDATSTQRPSDYEILEEGPAGMTVTFCSHGNRVWVTRSQEGAVAVAAQPDGDC